MLKLSKYLIKKYKIKPENILGHSDIAPDRKKDPGENFPWKYLAKNNISLWHNLKNKILKDYRNLRVDNKSKNLFLNNIFKLGYSKKSIDKKKYSRFITIAFQRRYRQELISGKIDQECLLISKNLVKLVN